MPSWRPAQQDGGDSAARWRKALQFLEPVQYDPEFDARRKDSVDNDVVRPDAGATRESHAMSLRSRDERRARFCHEASCRLTFR